MTSLDDLTLLQWFVSGDATLEANQSLRIQPANKLRQLLGKRGGLLATAYDAAMPPQIEVRRDTDYTAVLHQILLDHHFVPTGQELDSQVLFYSHHPVPEGYHIFHGQARRLWKQWWTHPSHLNDRHLQLDLFVLVSNQWYPIRDISLNSSTLYINTLRGETIHHGDDMMVWLEKDKCEEGDQTCFWTPPVAKPAQPVATATTPERSSLPPPRASGFSIPLTPPAPIAPAPQAVVDPTLAPVVYALDGRVYVQTAVGVVIIEGDNLKAYSPVAEAKNVASSRASR